MDYDAAERWFRGFPGEPAFAVIIGRHSGIYPRRFRALKNVPLVIDDAHKVVGLRPYLLRYLPEGVYYDRNAYASLDDARRQNLDYTRPWGWRGFRGQELAFDLDPENLDCPIHGTIEDKMRRHQGLSFCNWEFEEIRRQAASLADEAARRWSAVRVVYSGRGFHVHIMDRQAFRLTRRERLRTAKSFGRRYAIDEWVTSGEMRLIRLPYSLHGMVSRVVVPVPRSELARFRYDSSRAAPPRAR
jgi:DNA primase catalytic subunit